MRQVKPLPSVARPSCPSLRGRWHDLRGWSRHCPLCIADHWRIWSGSVFAFESLHCGAPPRNMPTSLEIPVTDLHWRPGSRVPDKCPGIRATIRQSKAHCETDSDANSRVARRLPRASGQCPSRPLTNLHKRKDNSSSQHKAEPHPLCQPKRRRVRMIPSPISALAMQWVKPWRTCPSITRLSSDGKGLWKCHHWKRASAVIWVAMDSKIKGTVGMLEKGSLESSFIAVP